MKEILIDKNNASQLDAVAPELARIYIEDFALPPWNERSRCVNETCKSGFSDSEIGLACAACGGVLTAAYEEPELTSGWRRLIMEEDAVVEVAFDESDAVRRATIARPTNPQELYQRKYEGIDEMKPWLAENLPQEVVWIEDTFADISGGKKGNLQTRGRTLGRIASLYSGLPIATRTKSAAIVRSTLRDLPEQTAIYVGSEAFGSAMAQVIDLSEYGRVPDTRTLLAIAAMEITR